MKTAMQELIERLSPEQNGIKLIADSLLEIEKEQIIDAYCRLVIDDLGYILNDKYEYAENKRIAEEYYNQTYKQNK
jgi:uncharacterized protein (UPF0305 family)